MSPTAALTLCLLVATRLPAQGLDPVDPATQRVVVDNPWVRVLKVAYAPGQASAWHAHPERVVVLLTDWDAEMAVEGGDPNRLRAPKGTVLHASPLRHRVTNRLPSAAEAIEVELKPGAPPVAGPYPDGPEAAPANITCEYEDARIRVLRIRVGAEDALPMHGHSPRVVVELTGSSFLTGAGSGNLHVRDYAPGTTAWVDRITWHREVNTGGAPYERITVEFKSGAQPLRRRTLAGRAVAFTDHGQGDPVVLVHDTLGDALGWSAVAQRLAERHRVVAYSRRHHFPDERPGPHEQVTPEAEAEDLRRLLIALGAGPVTLVAHGDGAWLAARLAEAHPSLVRRVVLTAPDLEVAPLPEALKQALAGGQDATAMDHWVALKWGRPFAQLDAGVQERLRANEAALMVWLRSGFPAKGPGGVVHEPGVPCIRMPGVAPTAPWLDPAGYARDVEGALVEPGVNARPVPAKPTPAAP